MHHVCGGAALLVLGVLVLSGAVYDTARAEQDAAVEPGNATVSLVVTTHNPACTAVHLDHLEVTRLTDVRPWYRNGTLGYTHDEIRNGVNVTTVIWARDTNMTIPSILEWPEVSSVATYSYIAPNSTKTPALLAQANNTGVILPDMGLPTKCGTLRSQMVLLVMDVVGWDGAEPGTGPGGAIPANGTEPEPGGPAGQGRTDDESGGPAAAGPVPLTLDDLVGERVDPETGWVYVGDMIGVVISTHNTTAVWEYLQENGALVTNVLTRVESFVPPHLLGSLSLRDDVYNIVEIVVEGLEYGGTGTKTPTYTESADFTVSDAQYVWDDNTLILNFTGRVNIWNMDVSNISITDGVCALAFTWRDYDAVSSDRMSITIKPNEIQRESLAGMAEPYIQFRNGSFHEASTNMGMVPVERPLRTVGDPPHHDPKCVITYGYHDGLLESYAHDYNQTSRAVHDGFSAWSDLNPYLEFVWVERDPLVWVEWVDYTPEYVGLACLWCLHNDPSMEIALYGYDCRGGRIYHDPNSVRNTVAHELGHILGLGHHTNTTHLMYGPEYQVDPYETHGYVVPDNLEGQFVGEAELYNQTMTLRAELDRLNTQLDRLEARGDRDGNTVYFETRSQANQFNRMVAEYNETVGKYNMTVDELNCMYEARDPWHSGVPDLSDLEIAPP